MYQDTVYSHNQVNKEHSSQLTAHAGNATEAAMELIKEYARERPAVVALWIFGIGFVLGWKLKPW